MKILRWVSPFIPLVVCGVGLAQLGWNWMCTNGALASGFLGGAILIAGWVWALERLRHAKRDRALEVITRLWQFWDSGFLPQAREHVLQISNSGKGLRQTMDWCRSHDERRFVLLRTIPDYFEHLGLLCKQGHIETKLLLDLMAGSINYYHKQYVEFIRELQRKQKRNENWGTIQMLNTLGRSDKNIAEQLKIPRETVKRVLKQKITTYEYFDWLASEAKKH